jgi:hypothetical protein
VLPELIAYKSVSVNMRDPNAHSEFICQLLLINWYRMHNESDKK